VTCDATAFGVRQGREVNVDVRINGAPMARWRFNKENPPGIRSLRVDAPISDDHDFTLRFLVDRPASPVDINESHDRRIFGLGLRNFSVTPISEATRGEVADAARPVPFHAGT
jgi:hypothetical protein